MFKILNFKIKIFFTKLRYGSHSLEYVNLFKKNDLRSPFAPCVKDEFVFHIMMYLKKNENVKVYKTKEPIQFGTFRSIHHTRIYLKIKESLHALMH